MTELRLGDRVYTQAELLFIFHLPVAGNGLVSMSHQLIAAKLNVAAGAPDGEISDAITDADALIGDLVVPPIGDGYLHPSVTSALNDELESFNSEGPADCDVEPEPRCGDGTVDAGEECDDGNTANGDGCSSTCQDEEEPTPACGDNVLDAGEQCDDGNTVNGDGCSSTCQIEVPAPVCGNGVVEAGEECDDGNADDTDGCTATCRIVT